jgi:hypothetical protein
MYKISVMLGHIVNMNIFVQLGFSMKPGSSKANWKETKSCLGQVFNFKLAFFTKCV